MKRVLRDQFTYRLAPDVTPVLEVEPGEIIEMESYDSSTGKVLRQEDIFAFVNRPHPQQANPAAGPVYINGAQSGDTLTVEILDIKLDEIASVRINSKKVGVLSEEMQTPYCHMVQIHDGWVIFSSAISFPVRPMVGVLATSPASGAVSTRNASDVGGNFDENDFTAGTTVYLPVHVPGALFALGDVHASMGDGEVSGGAIEVGACTTVRVGLIKGQVWPRPWAESATEWITVGCADSLEGAIKIAVRDMVDLLSARLSLSREEAFVLISARGDVRIGQSCGGIPATVRVCFPKLRVQVAV